MLTGEAGVAEFVIPPRSGLIGSTMFPGMARGGGLVVLAIRRLGNDRGARATATGRGRHRAGARPVVGDRVAGRQPGRARRGFTGHGPPADGAAGPPGAAGHRGAGRHGRAAGHRAGAAGGRRADRGDRDGRAAGGRRTGGLPGGLLADRGADRRADPAVDRDPNQRGGGPDRGVDRRHRRRSGPVRLDAGVVRADRGARSGRQQHRDRAHRRADRDCPRPPRPAFRRNPC